MKNNCINSGVPRRISTIAVVQNLIQRGAYIHIVAKQASLFSQFYGHILVVTTGLEESNSSPESVFRCL